MYLRALTLSIAAAFTGIGLVAPAHADYATATFIDKIGNGNSPGATVAFALNADGTIAAAATSFNGEFAGFGFNSGQTHFVSHDFSSAGTADTSWGTAFGNFDSGWVSLDAAATAMTWTIGLPGSFSSVFQAFSANDQGHELFAFSFDGVGHGGGLTQWAANTVAAVPEPSTYASMFGGLAVIGWAARRRPARSRAASN